MESREQTVARGEAELERLITCAACEDTTELDPNSDNGWRWATWVDGEPCWLCPECQRDDVDQVF